MIAEVVPLRRLPRKLSTLDYTIPTGLLVKPGSLVAIPFRGKKVFGVVIGTKSKTNVPVKMLHNVTETVFSQPLLTPQHLALARALSEQYHAPLGTVMAAQCPPLQPRKLRDIKISPFPAIKREAGEERYLWYHRPEEKQRWVIANLTTGTPGQTLIVVPEKWHIREWQTILSSFVAAEQIAIITSDASVKDAFTSYFAVRRGDARVILGTKTALFVPFHNLTSVILDFEHHPSHKNWDQAPRYHAREVAEKLTALSHASLFVMSHTPSVTSAVRLQNHPAMRSGDTQNIVIANLGEEQQKKNYSIWSDAAYDGIQKAIQERKDIVIFNHRRGAHTSIVCQGCGRAVRCPNCSLPLIHHEHANILACHPCHLTQPMVSTCAFCRGPSMKLLGVGAEQVTNELKKILHDHPYHIITIEGETTPASLPVDAPVAIIGTSRALPFIRFGRVGTVCIIDADSYLTIPEFHASEEFLGFIRDIHYAIPRTAMLYLQTREPYRSLITALVTGALGGWYREELSLRRALHYPPFWSILKLSYGAATREETEKTAALVFAKLTALTKDERSAILTPPYLTHPPRKMNQYGVVLLVRMPPEEAKIHFSNILEKLNLAVGWKIDVNPLQLLS
ncbi:MAG: hypothetical protein HY437_00925 [Candidatus Magasanikbacteria bacterium]|nr:hypothetical protein [Candidatus Magasanikbacteria bacterium]